MRSYGEQGINVRHTVHESSTREATNSVTDICVSQPSTQALYPNNNVLPLDPLDEGGHDVDDISPVDERSI